MLTLLPEPIYVTDGNRAAARNPEGAHVFVSFDVAEDPPRTIKLTGYRILNTMLVLAFVTAKLILKDEAITLSYLDFALGGLLVLGYVNLPLAMHLPDWDCPSQNVVAWPGRDCAPSLGALVLPCRLLASTSRRGQICARATGQRRDKPVRNHARHPNCIRGDMDPAIDWSLPCGPLMVYVCQLLDPACSLTGSNRHIVLRSGIGTDRSICLHGARPFTLHPRSRPHAFRRAFIARPHSSSHGVIRRGLIGMDSCSSLGRVSTCRLQGTQSQVCRTNHVLESPDHRLAASSDLRYEGLPLQLSAGSDAHRSASGAAAIPGIWAWGAAYFFLFLHPVIRNGSFVHGVLVESVQGFIYVPPIAVGFGSIVGLWFLICSGLTRAWKFFLVE